MSCLIPTPKIKELAEQFPNETVRSVTNLISSWQEDYNKSVEEIPSVKELKNYISEIRKPSLENSVSEKTINIFTNVNENEISYQLPQGREQEEFVASEKTIRDLAARMSDRIGIPVRFESDKTKKYKGKLENDMVVINLAYATLDTPIHEILGHPIIRAIKNGTELTNFKYKIKELNDSNAPGKFQVETYSDENLGDVNFFDTEQEAKEYVESLKLSQPKTQLYQNLLKELEYGKGKEVLDRIKRDYNIKDFNIIENLLGSEIFKDKINALNTELKNIPEFPKIEDFKITKSKVLKSASELSINGKSLGYIKQDVRYFYWHRPSGAVIKIGNSSNAHEAFRKVILKTLQKEFNLKYNISEISKKISRYSEKITVVKNAGDTSKGLYYLTNESGDNLGNYSLEELRTIIGEENFPKYTLEEQQEEALVELLGLYTADKLDNVKDGKLISLLKRLLKEIKAFVRDLLSQREVEIDKLPDNMTLGDIANLLAYSNSKLILPGNEVIYTTPDNQQFKTYAEASNHISNLAKSGEDVDLVDLAVNISIENIDKEIETLQKELDNFKFEIEPFNKFVDVYTNKGRLRQNYWARKKDGTTGLTGGAKETLLEPEYDGFVLDINRGDGRFITKISDEEAEKLYYAQENKFNIATKASREKYAELETKIHNLKNNSLKGFIEENKEYEQAKEIIEKWIRINNIRYNPEEVYSRGQGFYSVMGAYSNFELNLMLQNLLEHIKDNKIAGGEYVVSATTDVPNHQDSKNSLVTRNLGKNIYIKITPKSEDIKWATATDCYSGSVLETASKFSKDPNAKELLGVSKTKVPSLGHIHLVEPSLASAIENVQTYKRTFNYNELGVELTGENFRLEYDEDVPYTTKKIIDSINSILDEKYGKLVEPEISKIENKSTGIQPTQTNGTLKESIESVRIKLAEQDYAEFGGEYAAEDMEFFYPEKYDKKEYTSQALINTKVAKLKEVAKKYPRSLIRSEVRPINSNSNLGFTKNESHFQKVSSDSFQQSQQELAKDNKDAKYQQIEELFKSNPELANAVYSSIGLNMINESEITYTDENGNPCAKDGMRSSTFTKGSEWEVVKDLKGYPSHAQGGVDIKLGKDGFSFAIANSQIKAAYGLLLPKIN